MILEILPMLLTVGGTAGVLAASVMWNKKQREALRAALSGDRDIEIVDDNGWFSRIHFATRPPLRGATMVAMGGGKNNPSRWDIATSAHAVGARTTVSLTREGFSGKLREALGKKDVHLGDVAFDALVCLRGDEPDVVRGIFSSSAVQQATRALFEDRQLWRFSVDGKGSVTCAFSRGRVDAVDVKRKLLLVVALANALENAAEDHPLPDPGSVVHTSGVGGASGAPVSISLVGRR